MCSIALLELRQNRFRRLPHFIPFMNVRRCVAGVIPPGIGAAAAVAAAAGAADAGGTAAAPVAWAAELMAVASLLEVALLTPGSCFRRDAGRRGGAAGNGNDAGWTGARN